MCAVMSDAAADPELPPVLGWTELTEALNLSKTRLRQLESSGDLPLPIAELRMGRVWSTKDIRQWCTEQGRTLHPLRRVERAEPRDESAGPPPGVRRSGSSAER